MLSNLPRFEKCSHNGCPGRQTHQSVVRAQQKVRELQVPVQDRVAVEVRYPSHQLTKVGACGARVKATLLQRGVFLQHSDLGSQSGPWIFWPRRKADI
jgi:hypothetical protein